MFYRIGHQDAPVQAVRVQAALRPDAETLNLLVSVKDKLRNYLFSKVDDENEEPPSPITRSTTHREQDELVYDQWWVSVFVCVFVCGVHEYFFFYVGIYIKKCWATDEK